MCYRIPLAQWVTYKPELIGVYNPSVDVPITSSNTCYSCPLHT